MERRCGGEVAEAGEVVFEACQNEVLVCGVGALARDGFPVVGACRGRMRWCSVVFIVTLVMLLCVQGMMWCVPSDVIAIPYAKTHLCSVL